MAAWPCCCPRGLRRRFSRSSFVFFSRFFLSMILVLIPPSVRPSSLLCRRSPSLSFFLQKQNKKNMEGGGWVAYFYVIFILFISLDVPRLPASCRAAVFFEVTELFLLVPRRKWRRTFFYWVFTEFLGGPLSCYRVLGGGTFICFFFINFGTQPKNKTR